MVEQPDYLLGIHEFRGRTEDELDIGKGDYIEVVEDDAEFGDSWYIGRNLSTGRTGLFPKVFTTSVVGLPPGFDPEFNDNDSSSVTPAPENEVPHPRSGPTPTLQPSAPAQASAQAPAPAAVSAPARAITTNTPQPKKQEERPQISVDTSVGKAKRGASVGNVSLTKTMSDIDQALSEIAAATAPNMSNIGFWTPFEVRSYFLSRGYDASTAERFVQHQITGSILLELDLAHLKEIDISSFGTRFEISKDIKVLNQHIAQSRQVMPGPDTPVVGGPRTPNMSDAPTSHPGTVANSDTTATTVSTSGSTPDLSNGHKWGSHHNVPMPGNSTRAVEPKSNTLQDSAFPLTPVEGPPHWSQNQNNTALSTPASSQHTDHTEENAASLSETSEEPDSFYKNAKHSRSVSDIAFPTNSLNDGTPVASTNRSASNGHGHHRRHSSVLSVLSGAANPLPTASPAAPGNTTKSQATPKRQGTFKGLRSASSQYLRPTLVKQKTSAFLEGIKQTTAKESANSAEYSGWMHKRGGLGVGTWKSRFFTLHGTRLSYFTAFKDTKERGLIDITGHRVVAAKENEDRLISLYAVGVGAGRFCFKLVPPGPGYKKGVSFTAPKIHYFAVDSQEEMREWMAAIMKATIERDESVPVVSSCTTPTVSLPRAQEMVAERLAQPSDSDSDDDASAASAVDVIYNEQQQQTV